jgi:GrpB-like predicted nucleotidyltransferase (UPF0157 family)/GNAT superfamily N-acetyltransferase
LAYINDIAIDIVHTGSTSVPGLAAKPIIDFNIIIESYDVFPQITLHLQELGYEHDGDGGIAARERFKSGKRDGFMDYHMYVCPKDSPELERQILFRNYLRQNDGVRDEYAALKQSLAEKHRHDIDSYIAGKHEFIMNVIELTRKQKTVDIRLAVISDAPEFKKLNDLFNGDDSNSVEGIEKSLENNKQEIALVAGKGYTLVGYCCGQIQSSMCYSYDYAVITEFYVMDEYRRQGIGRRLLMAIEVEFNKRNITHFHLSTGDDNVAALALYRSCGYEGTSIMLEKDSGDYK